MSLRPVLCLLLLATTASSEPLPDAALRKIAPWVLKATEGGQKAEFMVVLRDQADLSPAALLVTKEAKGRFVYETLYAHAARSQASMLADLDERGAEYQSFYIVNAIWVKGDGLLAADLARRADVARIDANPLVRNVLPEPEWTSERPDAAPLAPLAAESGVSYVRAPQVWALGITGQGVVVGGQDTGIRWTHQALKPHYRGWNGLAASHDYNWHDSIHSGGGSCGANSTTPCDDDGHGSHTIGTAVGSDLGSNQIGVAPGARWIGCRNMDQGNGTPTTYLECFQFFLAPYPVGGTTAQGNPLMAPDVTTNSWGCPTSEGCNSGNFETMRLAIAAQRAAGILTEASAGNDGSACHTVQDPPAMFDESFSVGALNTGSDSIASFSSRGTVTVDGSGRVKPDIAAPGTNTRSVDGWGDTGYTSMSGTSMAGPHVGGGAALVIAAFPALKGNVNAIEARLAASAFRISSTSCGSSSLVYPNNTFGNGRMDLGCAIPGLVSGSASICQGGSATLSVALVGSAPWTLTWSDGYVQNVSTTQPATRIVSPSVTTTYTVTTVTNGTCSQSAAGSATVTVSPDTTAPAVTAPATLVLNQSLCCATGFGGASGATSAALASFLAGGSATEECSSATRLAPQVSGADAGASTCFQAGTTTVTFRYRDVAGNTGTATSNVTVRMFGDLDLNGILDSADVVVLRAYVNGVVWSGVPPFYAPLGLADVSHDGGVDAGDLIVLRGYLNSAVSCLAQ